MGPMVSVATAQLCCYRPKAAKHNYKTNEYNYVSIKIYLQKQVVGYI